jgi:dGTPase
MQWSKLLSPLRLPDPTPGPYDLSRPPWQIDYDRLIFCSAFRRLQDKTQVHPLSASDYVRTRLTHSLEVSSVARTIGTRAGDHILRKSKYGNEPYHGGKTLNQVLTPSDIGMIVSAAALAHDIGNPPFGHSGEDAIRYWFATSQVAERISEGFTPKQRADIEKWDGNAAGFRILSRLQFYRNKGGMKLTAACLGAYMKYPTAAAGTFNGKPKPNQGIAGKKPGFFESDRPQWVAVAKELGLIKAGPNRWCRHPLAYLTEAADDICNQIIDFEDGYRLGRIPYKDVESMFHELVGSEGLSNLEDHLSSSEKVAYMRAKAIRMMVDEAVEVFISNEEDLLAGKPLGELVSLTRSATKLAALKTRTKTDVFSMPNVLQIEAAGFEIIGGLLDVIVAAIDGEARPSRNPAKDLFGKKVLKLIPEEFVGPERKPDASPYERLLLAIDFVSGMTDTFALDLFRKLRGVTIPR